MATKPTMYWNQLWSWVTSSSLLSEELEKVLCPREVLDQLVSGLNWYKPGSCDSFSRLQSSEPNQAKLLSIVQTLHQYMDIDCFQIWDVTKHFLSSISYGTPVNALKNATIVDIRPSFLLPNIWKFYHAERLYVLKLMQYIIENKDNEANQYNKQFKKVIKDMDLSKIKKSLLSQLENVLASNRPLKKIQTEFGSDTVRQEWAESVLREQLFILQNLLLISNECPLSMDEFKMLFGLFMKHGFGKKQGFNDLLEERHREYCLKITYMEVCLFLAVNNSKKINNVTSWIDCTKELVEGELTKLQVDEEHGALLITWMMLTLQSPTHAKLFESQYQHFGATALRMRVFEFFTKMLKCSVFSDDSQCALIAKQQVFSLLNELCNKFDCDGSLSHHQGVMQLCSLLLSTEEIADAFWKLHAKSEEYGVVSLWNTALEYFPYNFSPLSILASGLAQGGKCSVCCLTAELKNLPVFTEVFRPNHLHIESLSAEEAVLGRDYFPLDDASYRVARGSSAVIREEKDTTLIHFRTPISYWTVFNVEIEKALDRKGYQMDLNDTLEKIYEGTKVLKGVLKHVQEELPSALMAPSEGVFDVLTRFMGAESTPLPLLVECLEVCTALIPIFAKEIHSRLTNTGLLPRLMNYHLAPAQYASGASFDSAALGSYLVNVEQPNGSYQLLGAYLELLQVFFQSTTEERIIMELILPGTIFVLREVFPNISGWRYTNALERRALTGRCVALLNAVLQPAAAGGAAALLKNTCVYSLLHTENAMHLLHIVSVGNDQLERMMYDEPNWSSGSGSKYITTVQRAISIVMLILKPSTDSENPSLQDQGPKEPTALEHLIFTQNKQTDALKVVPRVASYINHAFNKNFAVLSCRLLKRFSESFQMSLFSSLDVTAYQVRNMFLGRLRDPSESVDLKVAILEFLATCVGRQPGLTEAFFKMNHIRLKALNDKTDSGTDSNTDKSALVDDGSEGILGYMADYLGTVKTDPKYLHSPLLACMMTLFHALWKNNMQILVKELMENPKFWDHMTSPLFNNIQPGLRTYAQIFNVIGIELFVSRNNLDPNLKEMLEKFFDTNQDHLDKWITYIFTYQGRGDNDNVEDKSPTWLGLLTSWKDFTTICCKCLPFSLNIAHKAKMVAPCLSALQQELENFKDGRLVVILAELYVVMLANWKDDCFEKRKANAKQIDQLLTNAAIIYDSLHPRAKRAILSIGTVAISHLDYEIKASTALAQSVIQSVTDINSYELEKLLTNDDDVKDVKTNGYSKEDIPPIVLSLAMLEQCLELYDDKFSGLSQWFQTTHFTNRLLFSLQNGLQSRAQYHCSLAALRCLTAYSRSAFSGNLLVCDVDQFLWLQLLPPKFEVNSSGWKPEEWWRIYAHSLDFISMMLMRHGAYFVSSAITFVGVHTEHLVEAVLLPGYVTTIDSLNLCAAALNLFVQLVKFEERWRIENINSMNTVMRSMSGCLQQCVELMVRTRRPPPAADPPAAATATPAADAPTQVLHRIVEIVHMSALCLVGVGPPLLTLLAEPARDAGSGGQDASPPLAALHATAILTKTLNHCYHLEEVGSRSPRAGSAGAGGRRRCSCGSPGAGAGGNTPGAGGGTPRAGRSDSLTSVSSGAPPTPAWRSLPPRLLAGALASTLTLLAQQVLMAIRDPKLPSRQKQLIRRELSSELTAYHEFVRKRIVCATHARPELARHKLGARPLETDEGEARALHELRRRDACAPGAPPPPPPKRASTDSMREYILRKQYRDRLSGTPARSPPSPVSTSTPAPPERRRAPAKRVSWAECPRDVAAEAGAAPDPPAPDPALALAAAYSHLTDVQINCDDDYFHFMSVVFLYVCQTEL